MTTKTVTTTICDRCKREIDRGYGLTIQHLEFHLNDSDQGGSTTKGLDLCHVCTQDFTGWLKNDPTSLTVWLKQQLRLAEAQDQGGTLSDAQTVVGMKGVIGDILKELDR